MTDPQVSVIIPAYQSARLLPRCLEALSRNRGILEIIVVDDASTDDTAEALRRLPVRLVRNETNKGPVAARNIGASQAQGKYLLFLDSDIELADDYIEKLAGFLEERPQAAGAGGRIDSGQNRIWHNFGYRFSLRSKIGSLLFVQTFPLWSNSTLERWLRRLSRPLTLNFVPDRTMEVGWTIESAFMTSRQLFERLGGFDEGFFMFHEGPDYSERARALGYSTWYMPQARARHLDLASHPRKRRSIRRRSGWRYLKKHGLRLW